MGDELRGRLRRAFGVDRPVDRPTERARSVRGGSELREFLRRREERRRGRSPVCAVELPPGEIVENARGRCWVRRLEYSPSHEHGREPLAGASRADFGVLADRAKDDRFRGDALGRCLFLDTETTGLSGGAGTAVFLTGVAFLDRGRFVLEQLFLRTFEDEPAALRHIATRLAEHPLLVTYVGKTFDRHRLAARMAVCRIDAPILEPLHLDLYYLARREFGQQLPDVKLRTVEERILGFRRVDDLPGSDAPQAFFDWMRDGTGRVDRVLEHNRLDVLSLIALLGVLGRPSG